MKTIVPLAGPDFHDPRYGVKPLVQVRGLPLLEAALFSRPWFQSGLYARDLIFVLRDTEQTDGFERYLAGRFPGHRRVRLSAPSGGALMSALAAAALIRDERELVAVDLVDVLYGGDLSPGTLFGQDPDLAGLIPCFTSDDPGFSYLRLGERNEVLETAEKRVISRSASAGTYFFRDLPTFLEACAGTCARAEEARVRGSLFLCPAYNALIRGGRRVLGVEVTGVEAVSKGFHAWPPAR